MSFVLKPRIFSTMCKRLRVCTGPSVSIADLFQVIVDFFFLLIIKQVPTSVPSQLELGMAPPNNVNPLPFYQSTTSTQPAYSNAAPVAALPPQQHQSYPGGIVVPANNDRSPFTYIDSKDNTSNSSLWIQNSYPNMNNSNSSSSCPTTQLQQGMGTGAASETQLAMQGIIQDYEDMHPFFESIDDRQSYIGSKDACESRYA